MCQNKVSFRTKATAESKAEKWGQRVYECPICFCWHCTSADDWKSEFVTVEEMGRRLRAQECKIRAEFNEKLRDKNREITLLKLKIKRLKYGQDED